MAAALGDSLLAKAVSCAVSAIVFKADLLQTVYEGSISVAALNGLLW